MDSDRYTSLIQPVVPVPRFVKDVTGKCAFFNIAVRFKWDLSQASNVVMNLPDGRSWRLLTKGSGILSLINLTRTATSETAFLVISLFAIAFVWQVRHPGT